VAPSGLPTQSINYDSSGTTTTVQPYMEVEAPLTKRLRLTSGLKYAYFRQSIDERPEKADFTTPTATGGSYHALLPSASLHYMAMEDVSLYAQYAAGIMMPPTALYEVRNNGSINSLPEAQRTKSYQIGGVVKPAWADAELGTYYVNFNNAITSSQDATGESVYANNGGVTYR
jgi:iron complex outermembrane receptor protein